MKTNPILLPTNWMFIVLFLVPSLALMTLAGGFDLVYMALASGFLDHDFLALSLPGLVSLAGSSNSNDFFRERSTCFSSATLDWYINKAGETRIRLQTPGFSRISFPILLPSWVDRNVLDAVNQVFIWPIPGQLADSVFVDTLSVCPAIAANEALLSYLCAAPFSNHVLLT